MTSFALDEETAPKLFAIRGSVVHSVAFGTLEKIEDGAIVYEPQTGLIHAVFDLSNVTHAAKYQELHVHQEIDHRGKLIIPGFVDAHCHAPQYIFTGTGMDLPLLEWLEKYTFPSEAKFQDVDFARMAYEKSIKRHLRCGTTFASYFATIHNDACKVLVEILHAVGQRAFVGKVSMDRHSPPFYCEETEQGVQDAEDFVQFVLSQTEVGREFLLQVQTRSRSNSVSVTASRKKSRTMSEASVRVRDNNAVSASPATLSSLCREGGEEDGERTTTVDSLRSSPDVVPLTTHTTHTTHTTEHIHTEHCITDILTDEEEAEAEEDLLKVAEQLLDDTGMCEIRYRGFTLLNRATAPLVLPCVTPRFVPTCTAPMMHKLGNIAARYGLPIQSHMSESVNEIDWVSALHPECPTYADVYERHGLLNERAYMAHCCHCTDEEMNVLLRTRASVVHCASSNFMLSSGVMDVRQFLQRGIHVAIGTDVAGGYSPSMLDAMRQTIVASRVKGFEHNKHSALRLPTKHYHPLTFAEAFHLATVGGATVLGFGDVLGNFLPGKKLDCLVVDVHAEDSPIDTFDHETFTEHFEKFLFLGDDRNIVQVFVDGRQVI